MCHFCDKTPLDDALTQVQCHGFELLQPNAPVQYGVTWDGRLIAHTEKRERAVQMAAEQDASQPGRWEAKQRKCGAWRDLGEDVAAGVKSQVPDVFKAQP